MIKLISPRMRLKLFTLLTKHGISVIHSEPGKIVANIGTWRQYEYEISQLIAELRADQDVYEAYFSNGVAEITYNEAVFSDRAAIERWLGILEKYPF